MKENTPSRTAQYMAFFRALENTLPAAKRLFNDPYAHLFLDSGLKAAVKLWRMPLVTGILTGIIERRGPGAMSSGIARTRYIDDLLQQAVNAGAQQVIILGAGFDTRALRLPFLQHTHVIEIDHPDTFKLKYERLKKAMPAMPSHVSFYQLDFNRSTLNDLAQQHNINFAIPTVVIWEGVTNYLSRQAVAATFTFLEKFVPGSSVIFTYIDQKVLDNPEVFYGISKIATTLSNSEERWTIGFKPEEMAGYVGRFGYTLLEDCCALDYRKKYMPERVNISRGYEFYHVAWAQRSA